ncbi:hypothetical protein GW17_00030213, partial [Ensete ventricosum]
TLTRSGRNGLLLFVYRLWRFFCPFFSRAEECQPSGSSRGQSNPLSLSSGVMTRADVKALQALEEILAEEATRRALKVPIKRPAEDSTNHRKKTKVSGRQRSHHEGDKSRSRAAKGKRPIDLAEETLAPRTKPKSVEELLHFQRAFGNGFDAANAWDADLARWGSFDEIYLRHTDPLVGVRLVHLVIRGSNGLGGEDHGTGKFPLDPSLSFLRFAFVFNTIAHPLLDRVHDVGRVITSLDNKVDFLCKEVQRLKEVGDP